MILVTVGMDIYGYDRLVQAADELASLVDEDVIIQRGTTTYVPRFAKHVDYVDGTQIEKWMSEARVVVAHGGAGTILDVLKSGKPLILAPRARHLGEHIDDHQFELSEALTEQGWVVAVTELSAETLSQAISQATQLKQVTPCETGLHSGLREWLNEQAVIPHPRRWRLLHWCRRS